MSNDYLSWRFGDLVALDLSIEETLKAAPVAEISSTLDELWRTADAEGLSDVWSRAKKMSCRFAASYAWPDAFGASLKWACHIGAGFGNYDDLPAQMPDEVDALLSSSNPSEKLRGLRMKNTIAPLVEVRGPELDAARRVAARAASETGLPFVALSTDQNGWAVYSFETGYRKRLAYALAFEASLKAGSLLPYKERLPALISGSLADLISACPAVDERLAFSVYLNLTGYLDQAVHEQELGKPAHWLPGPLRDATEKRAWLWDRLREAARLRGQSLTSEGQRAIEILLQEAAMPIEDHAHLPRIWSVIASEQTYQAG